MGRNDDLVSVMKTNPADILEFLRKQNALFLEERHDFQHLLFALTKHTNVETCRQCVRQRADMIASQDDGDIQITFYQRSSCLGLLETLGNGTDAENIRLFLAYAFRAGRYHHVSIIEVFF